MTSRMHRLEQQVNQAVGARIEREGFRGVRPSHISFLDQMGSGCRMGELARRLNVTQAAVTQMTDQLETMGLVRRERDAGDRRAVVVRPTALVERSWAAAREAVDEVEGGWASKLGPERFAQLRAMIDELVEPLR